MFERLTEPARRVVSSAGEESDRLGHNYVGCEHVLAGIVRQIDSAAARMLGAHGLDLQTIRAELDRMVDRGILPPPWHNDRHLLDSLGVDLDAVLRSMEDAFGEAGGRSRNRWRLDTATRQGSGVETVVPADRQAGGCAGPPGDRS